MRSPVEDGNYVDAFMLIPSRHLRVNTFTICLKCSSYVYVYAVVLKQSLNGQPILLDFSKPFDTRRMLNVSPLKLHNEYVRTANRLLYCCVSKLLTSLNAFGPSPQHHSFTCGTHPCFLAKRNDILNFITSNVHLFKDDCIL